MKLRTRERSRTNTSTSSLNSQAIATRYLNDTFADQTRFGQRIVHGALVSGLISAALAALPGMTVFLPQDLEFRRPIEIGDTVAATCKVVEAIEADRYCLTVRVRDSDDEVAIYGTATVLIDELPGV